MDIIEGKVKKGGVNEPPTKPRPKTPPSPMGSASYPISIEVGQAMLDVNLCLCLECHITGTGAQFTVATGGGDYDGQCPNCHAGCDKIISVDDDHEEFIEKLKELS